MKIDDITLRGLPQGLKDFKDQVLVIANYGKYSSQTVVNPPTWIARNGEFAFLNSSGQNRIYFYANNQWNYIGGGAGGITPAGLDQQVQVNSGGTLYADAGFLYNPFTAVGIQQNSYFVFDSNSTSGTNIRYNTSNNYLEIYVGSEVRIQM